MPRFASALLLAVASLGSVAACAKSSSTSVSAPAPVSTDSYFCSGARFHCEPADVQMPSDKLVPAQTIQVDTNLWVPSRRSKVG